MTFSGMPTIIGSEKYVSISSRNSYQVLLNHKRYLPSCQCMIDYLFALPLNRQEKLWRMLHLDIGKSTMANWIQYSYRLYLRHIDRQMHRYLL